MSQLDHGDEMTSEEIRALIERARSMLSGDAVKACIHYEFVEELAEALTLTLKRLEKAEACCAAFGEWADWDWRLVDDIAEPPSLNYVQKKADRLRNDCIVALKAWRKEKGG